MPGTSWRGWAGWRPRGAPLGGNRLLRPPLPGPLLRLTVNRLGLPAELRRSLACTNIIENMNGTVIHARSRDGAGGREPRAARSLGQDYASGSSSTAARR